MTDDDVCGLDIPEDAIRLDLSHNSIGDKGAIALARKLRDRKGMVIDVSYNRIGDEGAIELAKFVCEILGINGLALYTHAYHNHGSSVPAASAENAVLETERATAGPMIIVKKMKVYVKCE